MMDCFWFFSKRAKRQVWIVWALIIAGPAALSACAKPIILEPSAEPRPTPPVVAPVPDHPARRPNILPGIQFTIQVGAFSSAERAADYATELMRHGLDAYYFIDEDGLCKVRFSRFVTRGAACQRALELQTLGWIDDFFIVQPVAHNCKIDPRPTLRQRIVRTARRFLGTAYRWGGESARRGFDCSGLTMTVYRLNGLDLPRNSREQYHAGTPIKRSALQRGDLVFFATGRRRRVSHVGIYAGNGRFIHAPGQGKSIGFASLASTYFKKRYIGARRYF
jgi:hypothetical protein